MTADLDEVELRTDLGGSFRYFTNITWSKNFLDPCQTMTADIAADETRFDVLSTVQKGSFFTLLVNGAPQMSGIIDCREVKRSRASGTVVHVEGRDFMSRVVDPNGDPRIVMSAEMPFDQFCQKLFAHFGFEDVTLFEDYDNGRNIAVKKAIKAKGSKGKRRRKITDPAKDLRPKPGEGGWQWFIRIAHRLGYHAWHMPDGSGIVVGTPDYDQEPCFALVDKRSEGNAGAGAHNVIEEAIARDDGTGVPSDVFVRGKSTANGAKAAFIGHARNPNTTLFKPFYIEDDESSEQAHCDAKARLVLSKALQNGVSYQVTVRGLSDNITKAIFNVDTVASVFDEGCGVSGLMWVMNRSCRKSRAGTFTDMKLIPCDTLLFDYFIADSVLPAPKDYAEAKAKVPEKVPPPPNFMEWKADGQFKDRRSDG